MGQWIRARFPRSSMSLRPTFKSIGKEIFANMDNITTSLRQTCIIEQFLVSELTEDYTDKIPYFVSHATFLLAKFKGELADRKQAAKTLRY
jgi:hypothetical protein